MTIMWVSLMRRHRIGGCLAVMLACVVAVAMATPAAAAPEPSPSPSAPAEWCPTPSHNEQRLPGGVEPALPQVNWCLPWVQWQDGDGWLTLCSKATNAVEQERCDAVSDTLVSPPPDRTRSVLDERIPASGEHPVRCERFGDRASEGPANAERWKAKQARCEAARASLVMNSSLRPDEGCHVLDVTCQVSSQVERVVRSGFMGLVDIVVAGFAWALGKLAEVVFEQTSPVLADEPFYAVYNDLSGVLVVLVLVVFVLSTAINGLRLNGGPGPLSSLAGLVRALLGIAFAGGIAYLLMAAWDEATVALIERNQQRGWQPSIWVQSLEALTAETGTLFLGFAAGCVSLVGLVFLFVTLMFRSLLAAGAALLGAVAMTGQVMAETRSWGRKWFWTCNALASSKFFIAALWIYGTRTTYESDNVINVLRGMFIIVLMVLAPWILLRLTSMWDGYVADVDARGFMASVAGGVGLDAAGRLTGRFGDGGDGGGGDAPSLMQGNADAIPTIPTSGSGLPGLDDSVVPDAADALEGRGDSTSVGKPSPEPGHEQGGDENAQETAGVERDSHTARSDVEQGRLTVPGDTTGDHGSLPVTPNAVSAQMTGADTSNAGDAGALSDTSPAPGVEAEGQGEPGGAIPPAPGTPGGSGIGPASGGGPGADGGSEPGGQETSAAGARAGGVGRAGGAAAGGAAEVPIVPV
ncbi:hypothetical protein ACIA59_28970 [Micromonospora haikouensis]|uniref:hypothetical protein n=1 Tax=Micromonospora haikouensis TaxID=686309 RepID=UPI0037885810